MADWLLSVLLAAAWPAGGGTEQAAAKHPACEASADPARFDGQMIEDQLLFLDVSPHGLGFFSRYCDLKFRTTFNPPYATEAIRRIIPLFYTASRPDERVPRLVQARVAGRIRMLPHPLPEERGRLVWTLEITSVVDAELAPEGACAAYDSDLRNRYDCATEPTDKQE